jgi:hypothetical protein
MRYLLPLLLLSASLFGEQGNLVYSTKEGQIQFLTEKTPDGKIVGLLKPLKSNTSFDSIIIDNKKGLVSFNMIITQENPICASWTDIAPLIVQLDPKPVSEITLEGKIAKTSGNVTILIPNS